MAQLHRHAACLCCIAVSNVLDPGCVGTTRKYRFLSTFVLAETTDVDLLALLFRVCDTNGDARVAWPEYAPTILS